MFRSIRWTLQMWHAAILAMVLVAFGWVIFYLVLRPMTYDKVDGELSRMAPRIAFSVRTGQPWNGPFNADFQKLGSALHTGNLPSAQEAFARLQKDFQSRGPGRRPWNGRPSSPDASDTSKTAPHPDEPSTKPESEPAAKPENSSPTAAVAGALGPASDALHDAPGSVRAEWHVDLADDLKASFDEETDPPHYYIVWRTGVDEPLKSKFAPDVALPDVAPAEARAPRRGPPPHVVIRQRGEFREAILPWRRMTVLVGRSIRNDLTALNEKALLLAAAGLGVLGLGLLGGHWFSRRAIKPIEQISATAAEISLSNLSRRIDVTGTETELTGLARTLNQMFDRIESGFSQQIRFTADASHELRTPLAVILSHAELALGRNRSVEELRETIETCRRSGLRMKSLIESLLTLARFDSGEVQLECRPFDISRTVGDCVGLVRPLADQRRISLTMDLPPTSCFGDPERMAQVVTNLLTNAIRYNHEHGEVAVSVQRSSHDVVLTVTDTGIGIPPDQMPLIFERFYRVDKARSRKDGAIGLGLAICKSIVDAHGGEILVFNNTGGGSRFEVRLPQRSGPADPDHARRELEIRRAGRTAHSEYSQQLN